MRILWYRLQAELKNILWRMVCGVITQFMLFQEYTTGKRNAVLSTISDNCNSDFIFIGIDKQIYKQVWKSWCEKTTSGYTEKGFRKKAKRACKDTLPLLLKSKMAASRGRAAMSDFNHPKESKLSVKKDCSLL